MKVCIVIPVVITIDVDGDLPTKNVSMLVMGVQDNFHEEIRLLDNALIRDLDQPDFADGHHLSVNHIGAGSAKFRVVTEDGQA